MSLNGTRVFVVEDEALLCIMIEDFLVELNCQVVGTVGTLEEGVLKAAELASDVVVLDINLNGKLSYPIAQILRSRQIPFVIATGYGGANLPEDFKRVPVISKPFSVEQFGEVLRRALRRSA